MYFMIFLFICIIACISTLHAIHFRNKLNNATNYRVLYNRSLGDITVLEKYISQLNKNWHNVSYRDKYLLEIQKHKKATGHCRKLALENKELKREISYDQISIEILDSKNQELTDKIEMDKKTLEELVKMHNEFLSIANTICHDLQHKLRYANYRKNTYFDKWKRAESHCKVIIAKKLERLFDVYISEEQIKDLVNESIKDD